MPETILSDYFYGDEYLVHERLGTGGHLALSAG